MKHFFYLIGVIILFNVSIAQSVKIVIYHKPDDLEKKYTRIWAIGPKNFTKVEKTNIASLYKPSLIIETGGYSIMTCTPGTKRLISMLKNYQIGNYIQMDLVENTTYYFKVELIKIGNSISAQLKPVTQEIATRDILTTSTKRQYYCDLLVLKDPKLNLEKKYNLDLFKDTTFARTDLYKLVPKNRLGLEVTMGQGTNNIGLGSTNNGDSVKISFGGGLGMGILYGRRIHQYVDLALSWHFQSSSSTPSIENGMSKFKRHWFSITPSASIPLYGFKSRLLLGAGLDQYYNSSMEFDFQFPDGRFNDIYTYKNNLGYHISTKIEMLFINHWTTSVGIKYCDIRYAFKSSNTYIPNTHFIKPNGGSVDLTFNFCKNF